MKEKIAIIGCGNHVQKKILPALKKLNISPKLIISKNNQLEYDYNLSSNINDINSEFTHIIIVNVPSKHYEIINKVKNLKIPILVEKPIFIDVKHFKQMSKFLEYGSVMGIYDV